MKITLNPTKYRQKHNAQTMQQLLPEPLLDERAIIMKRMIRAATKDSLDKKLLEYIPRDFKPYVEDIYEGEKEWNEHTKRWNVPLVVEWENGETSYFANKAYARQNIKEQYMYDDVRKR